MNHDSQQLFKDGNLEEAIQQQLAFVKKNPSDQNARFFLAELFAFLGEWERADRQLDTIVAQSSTPSMTALLFRQLIRGEIHREQVFSDGRPPEFLQNPTPEFETQLRFCTLFRDKDFAGCRRILDENDSARQPLRGTCDGSAFEVCIDADDRLRDVCELITATGKYFWLSFREIESLTFEKPQRPSDLIWRRCQIAVRGSIDGEVFIPVRYPGPSSWGANEQLSRATDWVEWEEGIVTGQGQKAWLIQDDTVSLLDILKLEIAV